MKTSESTAEKGPGAALVVEHAKKAYGSTAIGRKEAVADVSITVTRGAIHGLLGPNGAGKTTTLKMLLGLVRPTAGRFEILGRPAHERGARSRLGFLPEQPYFPTQLTAGEALRLYGRLAGLGKAEVDTQTVALLERVGLEGKQGQTLSRFSRGMLQRMGVAQALLGDPEVVVLDEPASGLDPVGQRDIRNLMLELRSHGTSVLLSSHQLSEVEAVCDEVTILNRGAVAAVGHIDALLNVEGQASIRVRGGERLPDSVAPLVTDTAVSGGVWVLSVAQSDVRRVVDGFDDAGWQLESVSQKRDSLEDYFSRLLGSPGEGGVA